MKKILLGSLTLMLIFMMSCGVGTKVTGSWTKPEHQPQNFKKICVLGIGANSVNRRTFEDVMQTKLLNLGYPVVAALDYLPPNAAIGTITKEIVEEIFTNAGIDAVFTMSLRHEEDTRRYVPGSSAYVPYYYNTGFYNYYGGYGGYYYSPGYYTGSVQIYLEANLFNLKTDELIWSAETKTTDVTNVQKVAEQFSDVIIKDFVEHNVLKAPPGLEKKMKK